MKETIDDLRAELFATLRDLRNREKPMDIERAQAIAEVAQVMVNSAKVEVDMAKLDGSIGSEFIPRRALPGKPGVTVHRLK